MSFTSGIPASGQTLGSSRTQVLNNFSSLRTTLSNASLPNHIDVNATGAGKHIFLQMPVQSPSTANLTLSGEFGVIAQTNGGSSELFFTRDGVNVAGTPTYTQLTRGTPVVSASGYTFLPGGLYLQWGSGNSSVFETLTVTFPIAFTTLYSLTVSQVLLSGAATIKSQTNSGFVGQATGANVLMYWMAIGV